MAPRFWGGWVFNSRGPVLNSEGQWAFAGLVPQKEKTEGQGAWRSGFLAHSLAFFVCAGEATRIWGRLRSGAITTAAALGPGGTPVHAARGDLRRRLEVSVGLLHRVL